MKKFGILRQIPCPIAKSGFNLPIRVWICSLLFIVGSTYLAHRLHFSWPLAPSIAEAVDYDPEQRTFFWIESANTARLTGVWLALPDGRGGLTALESYSRGDDCGHAFLLTLVAWFKKQPVGREDLIRINFFINFLGILVLAIILFGARLPFAGGAVLLFVSSKALPGPLPGWDVYSSYIGVVCLSLSSVIWVWSRLFFKRSWREDLVSGVISYFSLGLAYLIRSPIGQIGILGLFLGVIVGWMRNKSTPNALLTGALFFTALIWTPVLIQSRQWTGRLPDSQHRNGHGVWQTLFHGLGTESNPWGIRWEDKYGYERVKSINPQVTYLSEPYMKIMRGLYLRSVWERPGAVLAIYARKTMKVVSLPIRFLGRSVALVAGIWLVMISSVLRVFPSRRHEATLSLVVTAFLFVFLAQGVLGIPWVKHLYPAKIILIIALSIGIDMILSRGLTQRT